MNEIEESMNEPLNALCLRLEYAQATQNEAIARATAAGQPSGGARCTRLKGGYVLWLGAGHMLNQAIALGLEGPLLEEDLTFIEEELGRGGHPVALELTPGADPSLNRLLARRGYQIQAFQQVWMRPLDHLVEESSCKEFEVRMIKHEEAEVFAQVVTAGFMEMDEVNPEAAEGFLPTTQARNTVCVLAFVDGLPAAGGTLAISGDVAVLSGTSVLPGFRGRGLQRALISARLKLAVERGCALATSATLPGAASQANLERMGFRVAYPKLEMAKPMKVGTEGPGEIMERA